MLKKTTHARSKRASSSVPSLCSRRCSHYLSRFISFRDQKLEREMEQTFQNMPPLNFLMVFLDDSDKTTILKELKKGEVLPTTPTMGTDVETFEYENIIFTVWKFGREEEIRPYMRHAQGLILVLDSTDRDRVEEARVELHRMMSEDVLRDAVLLVCANKNDCDNAMNVVEIALRLRLFSLEQRPFDVRSTCATTEEGLYEGLDWLSKTIAEKA